MSGTFLTTPSTGNSRRPLKRDCNCEWRTHVQSRKAAAVDRQTSSWMQTPIQLSQKRQNLNSFGNNTLSGRICRTGDAAVGSCRIQKMPKQRGGGRSFLLDPAESASGSSESHPGDMSTMLEADVALVGRRPCWAVFNSFLFAADTMASGKHTVRKMASPAEIDSSRMTQWHEVK